MKASILQSIKQLENDYHIENDDLIELEKYIESIRYKILLKKFIINK